MGKDQTPKNQENQNRKLDKKEKIYVMKRISKYLFKYKFLVLVAFALMLVSNSVALLGPRLSGQAVGAIEKYQGAEMIQTVLRYCLYLVGVYIITVVLTYILAVVMIHISQKVVYTMRKEVFNHLMDLPIGYFDTHATGEIISHISYDIDTVNASLSHDLLQVCASVITVVGSLIMMIAISPPLVFVFAITVPLSLLFTRFKSKRIRPLYRARSGTLGDLNGYAEEMLSGQKTIKVYNKERTIIDRFERKNTKASDAYYRAEYHGVIMGPSVGFINNLSISLVVMFGGILYMQTLNKGIIAMGIFALGLEGITAFVQYSRKFSGPINEFANIMNDLQSAFAAAERVFAVIDQKTEPLDIENAYNIERAEGNVELCHVSFGYVPGKTIIKDLSLMADKGKTIAIVGPTGAGKTTIINLLMRFYDIDSGEIKVDGREIRTLTRGSLRKSYTMVLQDTWLFNGTIFDNITYGKENATMEEVVAAAKAAKIHSFIERLPNGYNTMLSDDAINISKGQKQLITIARAMLPDSAMLILDEATSNVDSRTEIKIQSAMHKLMEGKTCFVIAHRLSTIQNADLILVVKDGNVIEKGNHEQLLAMRGFYSSLYQSQFD